MAAKRKWLTRVAIVLALMLLGGLWWGAVAGLLSGAGVQYGSGPTHYLEHYWPPTAVSPLGLLSVLAPVTPFALFLMYRHWR